jgi:catechol 2,3-dioxygenase-like lactoylglutathione lyase family enzyme
MIDHLAIQCADVTASAAFYDAVLAPVGGRRVMDFGDAIGFGVPPRPEFWIGPLTTGEGFRESHIAFTAPDRAAVRAFFQTAVDAGAEVLYEPRLWPPPSYYGASLISLGIRSEPWWLAGFWFPPGRGRVGVQVESSSECCAARLVPSGGGADRCHVLVPAGCAGQEPDRGRVPPDAGRCGRVAGPGRVPCVAWARGVRSSAGPGRPVAAAGQVRR